MVAMTFDDFWNGTMWILNGTIWNLKAIPPVVWAALMASSLTLAGVIASNKHTLKRLRIQLDADSKQKKEELTAELRKDVLLTLTDELMTFGSSLEYLLKGDRSSDTVSENLKNRITAFAKAHVVAEPSTVVLISKVNHSYSLLYNSVVQKLTPLQNARVNAKSKQQSYERTHNEVQEITKSLGSMAESEYTDAQKALLIQCREKVTSMQDQVGEVRMALTSTVNETLRLQKFVSLEMDKIVDARLELLVQIRQDLGFSKELPGLKEQAASQREEYTARIAEFHAEVQRELKSIEEMFPIPSKTSSVTASVPSLPISDSSA